MQEHFGVSVDIHQAIPKNGWRMKVTVASLGIYINGFRAYPSKKEAGSWAIYPPSQPVGSRFVPVIEFDKSMPLWDEIETKAKQAVIAREQQEAKLAVDSNISPTELSDVGF